MFLRDCVAGSPLVYVDLLPSSAAEPTARNAGGAEWSGATWGARILQTALRTYDRRALAQSYLAHAQKDLREQVEKVPGQATRADGGAGPRRKKYLNILRSLLSAQELHRSGALTPFRLVGVDDRSVGSSQQDEQQESSSSEWAPPISLFAHMQPATRN